ncbi:MAG: hypothetical protein JWO46_2930 [Nocardioidaceae bacterium]|nr:hypothetical protein [Nocardioidaceae bacterium]
MYPAVRWLVVAAVTAAVIAPVTIERVRPAHADDVSTATLVKRIKGSAATGWSGEVQSNGTLAVPTATDFAGVARLFGEQSDLRVWWRSDEHWRVDRIRASGESDLVRNAGRMTRWSFESRRATNTPYSEIRLPDESDVLPARLARRMLAGAKAADVTPLPDRRVNGHDSAGIRLVPSDARSTIARVDIWADTATGVATRVVVYADGNPVPILTTEVSRLDLTTPSEAATRFAFPAGIKVTTGYAVDDAAGANAFAPFLPPHRAAGLARTADDHGAVGVYGRGPTALVTIPLRRSIARDVYDELAKSDASVKATDSISLAVGPISVELKQIGRGNFLLAGTVTPATLNQAAADMAGTRYRTRPYDQETVQ